ncbi:MAG: cytidine deaminase [Candidatus Bipolaricaulota bacterium]|nr:cytidine deaminase [Candidatus Bipolaricaulota bacterium]MCX7843997.1 cytidine deaminase [Candidatus Bipolaricaulota bacterium]MDW8151750.1 cytidine deaminase [Candidatus Bipolaricaulota bacterium]
MFPGVSEAELVRRAVEARARAYAPYSGFAVGAALLAKDGRVFTGCNVENASYGLTVCAERVALFKAVSEGAREFVALAVACGAGPCAPCGACRQALYEFAPDLLLILADGEGRAWRTARLAELLPHGFGPKDLAR